MYTADSPQLHGARWVKSRRSGGNGGACVEIARNLPGIVAVRDSKNPNGAALVVAPTAWSSFLTSLRQ